MFALRTKKQLTTCFSPYYLMFGREARYPSGIAHSYEVDDSIEDLVAEELFFYAIQRQDDIFASVQANAAEVRNKIRKRTQQQGTHMDVKVGDVSRQRKGGQLDPSFLGPYTVVKVGGMSVDIMYGRGTVFPKINTAHLIHFEEPPAKQTKTSYIASSLHGQPSLDPATFPCTAPYMDNPALTQP
ncbi:hypothetical protein AALO_G00283570 [Alosa alosa]|uniref:Uncharacterized protein n=1 Tax=Alosa alosa TaxID=278164 RepID=A0AAV6FK46_9TELE|nr:hypothetical protein AALO_G00283570 [Alosa alosa]